MKKQRKPMSIYMRISLYAFCTATAVLIVARLLNGTQDLFAFVSAQASRILKLLSPFFTGLIIAYLLNPIVGAGQKGLKKLFPKLRPGIANTISVLVVYALIVVLVVLLIVVYLPGFVSNIDDLLGNTNRYISQVRSFVEETVLTHPLAEQIGLKEIIETQVNQALASVRANLSIMLSQAVQGTVRVMSSIINVLMALLISLYVLIERLRLKNTAINFTNAILPEKRARRTMEFFREVDVVFGRYLSAKLLESLALAVMCSVGLAAFGIRYSLLLGTLLGVLNLIPYVGSWIATALALLITLLDNPAKVGVAFLIIFIGESIQAWIIGPLIASDKLGINTFWVLTAVILGGGLFGMTGMLLGVPVMRIIQILYARFVQMRRIHRARQRAAEMEERNTHDANASPREGADAPL